MFVLWVAEQEGGLSLKRSENPPKQLRLGAYIPFSQE